MVRVVLVWFLGFGKEGTSRSRHGANRYSKLMVETDLERLKGSDTV